MLREQPRRKREHRDGGATQRTRGDPQEGSFAPPLSLEDKMQTIAIRFEKLREDRITQQQSQSKLSKYTNQKPQRPSPPHHGEKQMII